MTNQNPATPAPAATPGSVPAVAPAPAATTPAPTAGQGTSPEGVVAIPLKEYRTLQRQDARARSYEKRAGLTTAAGQGAGATEGLDADVIERLNQAESQRQAAELRAMQAEVRGEVRDLLEKDEFKNLPKSTKNLILKNPAILSTATTKELALLDIEDFVREQVAEMGDTTIVTTTVITPKPGDPPGHETPPASGTGGPSTTGTTVIEDLSKLRGPARSQAAIRNALKNNASKASFN